MTSRFTFILDSVPTESELDALFEAGCDDSTFESANGRALLHFDREAAKPFSTNLAEAAEQIESTGLVITKVYSEIGEMVTLRQIAEKTGRTYESVRLLAAGKRGPGAFPPPSVIGGGVSIYSLDLVKLWFQAMGTYIEAEERGHQEQVDYANAWLTIRSIERRLSPQERKELKRLKRVDA